MLTKPQAIFDRNSEWSALSNFWGDGLPGLRIGIVRGRRRYGKSFLLEHLCQATNGAYCLALQQRESLALERFGECISQAVGYRLGHFNNWIEALDTAVEVLLRRSPQTTPLLVIDEFPYLFASSPELPSILQALYDRRGPSSGHPPFRIILCGSAISLMSSLLAGNQALRGRAALDLRIGPFNYRDSARYWQVAPDIAWRLDAILGGVPGYRDLIATSPEDSDDLYPWLEQSLCNPSHILFSEPDYLLAEEPRITDRSIYYSIWEAISQGATTPTKIGGIVGMDARALGYYLKIMEDSGFIHYGQDLLLQRRPTISVADPVIKFNNLIVRPNLAEFEMRQGRAAWERSKPTFESKILGPHFEQLARDWSRMYAKEAGISEIGPLGTTVVACREHGSHEVDVVGLEPGELPQRRSSHITLLGEAKASNRPLGIAELQRLVHIQEVLESQGWKAETAQLALFSLSGFSSQLMEAADKSIHLITLEAMYGK